MDHRHRTLPRLVVATLIWVGLLSAEAAAAPSLYCPVGSTFFTGNYSLSSCTTSGLANTCWAPVPFSGSTSIAGSQYPSTNYACATSTPMAGAQENTLYTYDANGNLVTTTDPLGHTTTNTYDALNRLTQVLDPASNPTKYAYNLNDVLTQVIDPRNLATNYTVDGFGDVTAQSSPDTGNTTNTYDAAGNLLTRLDARGVTATYTYDAINRVTQIVYSKPGTPSETHTLTYDQGTNGKGRLTALTDTAGTTTWTYEAHGRVLTKHQSVGVRAATVTYAYNAAGQLAMLTTPRNARIGYTYSNNRVSALTINGATLISSAITEPFGPLSTWRWGNGLFTQRVFDTDGRLESWEYRNGTSILRNNIGWDIAGRVTSITNPADGTLGSVYTYDDPLDRLKVSQLGNPVTTTQQFHYDAVGNRDKLTVNTAVTNYTYPTGSNQLQALTGATTRSYVYDAVGNPTTIGGLTETYNNANRVVMIKNATMTQATYKVNGLGQRVEKTAFGVTTDFVYDEQGHLLSDGAQETVWLEDMPVATLRPRPSPPQGLFDTYYVLADHLGSPRAIVRPSDNFLMWRWDNVDPFGANADRPNGLGYALRFPGQYHDYETGTNYNYYRDYDPLVGRYEQSDPIGLAGGLNSYLYAASSPLLRMDWFGLAPAPVSIEQVRTFLRIALQAGKICLSDGEDCRALFKIAFTLCTKAFPGPFNAELCHQAAGDIAQDCNEDGSKYACPKPLACLGTSFRLLN